MEPRGSARLVAALALLLLLVPPAARAQTVRVQGDSADPASVVLREILERGRYRVIERDTVLPPEFYTSGDLVIAGADVRLEGRVEGSVAVVDGVLFVRSGAQVGGTVAAAGGEVYVSRLARVGGRAELPPGARTSVERSDGAYTVSIAAPPGPETLQLPGAFGLGLPTYDRVNGLSLRWGTQVNLGGGPLVARGQVVYHSARGALGGAVALEHPVGPEVWASLRAARETRTNEAWIRGDLTNSLAAFGLRSDARNYYATDEVSLSVAARPEQPLIEGEGRADLRLELRASRDRSLDERNPWSVFGRGEPWRDNPAIDEGTLVSAVLGSWVGWQGRSTGFAGDLAVEWAPEGVGDFEFVQVAALGTWQMQSLWRHLIEVSFYTRQTLGERTAPRQRWSFVGGTGTLPTLETGALRGDRVVFVESLYTIPLPARLALPVVGAPGLRLEHAVGSAWTTSGESPRWEQNLGVGLKFSLVHATLYINPADPSPGPELSLGASLPF